MTSRWLALQVILERAGFIFLPFLFVLSVRADWSDQAQLVVEDVDQVVEIAGTVRVARGLAQLVVRSASGP